METLDQPDAIEQVDSRGWFARAAALADRPRRAQELITRCRRATGLGDRANADLHRVMLALPPELEPLGRLAVLLSDPVGVPVTLQPVPLELGREPTPSLFLVPRAQAAAPSPSGPDTNAAIELSPYLSAEQHPAQALLLLLGLIRLATALPAQSYIPAPALHEQLRACRPETPGVDNPAKQLAMRVHERIPCFWGAGSAAAIAQDWAMRYLWYAESMAWAAGTSELSRLAIMARHPRFWPNTAVFVQLATTLPPTAEADPTGTLAGAVTNILARRRFPTLDLVGPAGLSDRDQAVYWLELGEWVALYASALYNVDPAQRVPLQILFGSP